MLRKYIIFLILMFALFGCGTDYFYSSFYIRKDFEWPKSPSQQLTLNESSRVTGGFTFNQFNSPAVVATKKDYILVFYENVDTRTALSEVRSINGSRSVAVNVAITKNAYNFSDVDLAVGEGGDPYGAPIAFVNKNNDVIVLATGGSGFSGSGDSRISVTTSTNNGYNWSSWTKLEPEVFKPLTEKGIDKFYTTSGNGTILGNGILACMIDFRTGTGTDAQGAAILYSDNDGKDWKIGANMTYSGSYRFARIIAERTDGSLLIAAVPNTTGGTTYTATGDLSFYVANSVDGNISPLTAVTGLPQNNGGNVSGSRIKYSHEGQTKEGIILLHSYPKRQYYNNNGDLREVTNAMSISISENGGQSWTLITNAIATESPKEFPEKAVFRQSMCVLKDGTIATATEESVEREISASKAMYITFRRFGLGAISYGKYVYEGL